MKQTRVYIAGSLKAQQRIGKEIAKLSRLGSFDILTSWLLDVDPKDHDGEEAKSKATRDIYAILEADLVILDTLTPSSTGGYNVELGATLIQYLNKKVHIIRIGPARNVFHSLIREKHETWNKFLAGVKENFKNGKPIGS